MSFSCQFDFFVDVPHGLFEVLYGIILLARPPQIFKSIAAAEGSRPCIPEGGNHRIDAFDASLGVV